MKLRSQNKTDEAIYMLNTNGFKAKRKGKKRKQKQNSFSETHN